MLQFLSEEERELLEERYPASGKEEGEIDHTEVNAHLDQVIQNYEAKISDLQKTN